MTKRELAREISVAWVLEVFTKKPSRRDVRNLTLNRLEKDCGLAVLRRIDDLGYEIRKKRQYDEGDGDAVSDRHA